MQKVDIARISGGGQPGLSSLSEIGFDFGLRRKFGFTLAEVLITLGIIGTVAAMTLPSIIQKQHEKVAVTQLKKAYSELSQAMSFAVNEDGTADTWNVYQYDSSGEDSSIGGDSEGAVQRYEPHNLIKRLKVVKNCQFKSQGCFIDGGYKMLGGGRERNFETLNNQYYKIILSDGTAMAFEGYEPRLSSSEDRAYGEIWVDINGSKKPNVAGKDLFLFIYTKDRIYPYGYQKNNVPLSNTNCKLNSSGYDCTSWVLAHGNMDYLYCDDLSWKGKSKCK